MKCVHEDRLYWSLSPAILSSTCVACVQTNDTLVRLAVTSTTYTSPAPPRHEEEHVIHSGLLLIWTPQPPSWYRYHTSKQFRLQCTHALSQLVNHRMNRNVGLPLTLKSCTLQLRKVAEQQPIRYLSMQMLTSTPLNYYVPSSMIQVL